MNRSSTTANGDIVRQEDKKMHTLHARVTSAESVHMIGAVSLALMVVLVILGSICWVVVDKKHERRNRRYHTAQRPVRDPETFSMELRTNDPVAPFSPGTPYDPYDLEANSMERFGNSGPSLLSQEHAVLQQQQQHNTAPSTPNGSGNPSGSSSSGGIRTPGGREKTFKDRGEVVISILMWLR
ncbi:hypothetical protein B0H63DRAFT_445033 [Podospora didyma]|uniref:Uncharacterized protein n=1 Tax=Podospora didyma TaxID=330526 RepID=A0AAE0P7W6_9PEZI|nr:hypothetical protein B0H63DRAFT_445033 [Podospora didyma]